ncbi:hypothetical protein ABHF33_03900 [Chitinibacter sp. FCG-7]|uniref:Uncharacterized protein n=1 Tax=Chitinibacter mangrovi TaxID=3153927 RepID=A0AAU7FCP4_9NEIS
MTKNLLKRLAALEIASAGEPSPCYGVLVELTLAKGDPMPTIDKCDHAAVTAALFEILPA